MTPDTIRKTTMIDENDTHTTDLLNSPVGPVLPTVTVEGWGTGTVAELEHHIHQLRDERDAARHALADLERRTNSPDALAGAELVAVISGIAERVTERAAERAADDIRAEIEYRVEESARIDGDAIWDEISDRVDESAAEAARQVIRDELVASVDLI
jgi:hypothetical protein